MLYTIGYEGLTVAQLTDALSRLNARLIDVRGTPHSRKRGFSGKALQELLGPKYTWKGDVLGNHGPNRVRPEGISWLRDASKTENLVILCLEASPAECHRHTLITAPYFPTAVHLYPQEDEMIISSDLVAGLASEGGEYDAADYADAFIG